MEKQTHKLLHANLDLAFVNSAYLSELWAVQDLLRIKRKFPNSWTELHENQLQDEIRHASLLLNALKKNNAPIVSDLKYSMQERVYKSFIDLSLSQTVEEAAAVHDLTEHRATRIYKGFGKVSGNKELVKLCQLILQDEQSHFQVNAKAESSPLLKSALQKVDLFLFTKHLPGRYGKIILISKEFWQDYYAGAEASTNYETASSDLNSNP